MTLFPAWFFIVLVYTAIGLATVGGATLIALIMRDWREGRLW